MIKIIGKIGRKSTAGIIVAVCWLTCCGCIYDSPITAKPTKAVNINFLGNWTSQDGREKMTVGKYDDENYVVVYDGKLYRAWESDVAGTPFFSVEALDSTDTNSVYKFTYMTWKFAEDGTLRGRSLGDNIVPDNTRGPAAVRKLLRKNLKNPDLFGDEGVFVKDK
jgi:hypothetical protein